MRVWLPDSHPLPDLRKSGAFFLLLLHVLQLHLIGGTYAFHFMTLQDILCHFKITRMYINLLH